MSQSSRAFLDCCGRTGRAPGHKRRGRAGRIYRGHCVVRDGASASSRGGIQAVGGRYLAILQSRSRDANPSTLTPEWRWNLRCWLADKPVLRELCAAREALFSLYQVRGHRRASKALTRLTDTLALSSVPELKTLRTTLMRWRREVLAYFLCRLTNARTEGFNGKAKLVIRRAYGYKSFRNYSL